MRTDSRWNFATVKFHEDCLVTVFTPGRGVSLYCELKSRYFSNNYCSRFLLLTSFDRQNKNTKFILSRGRLTIVDNVTRHVLYIKQD